MCNKITVALIEDVQRLDGIVEIDEAFIGGKDSSRHFDRRSAKQGLGDPNKTPVAGAVQRKGNVVARVVENVKTFTLTEFVGQAVSTKVGLLCGDDHVGYKRLKKDFPHDAVDRSKVQHVIGAVHTQTIDGFWSLINRGIMASFHKVSHKHQHLYVAELQFRYNNRENADIFGTAIKGC